MDNPRETLTAAAQLRANQPLSAEKQNERIEAQEHDARQAFRRLIDPGILRHSELKKALPSLEILNTIATNLLREPDNEKYQQFKPTNATIKRNLVEIKGALEYAVAMGFRAEVIDFQPVYMFNSKRRMADLRIGAEIIREFLDKTKEKAARSARAQEQEKAEKELKARQVKLAFQDDRQTRKLQDELEKERREARIAHSATLPQPPPAEEDGVPGAFEGMASGRRLASPPLPEGEDDGDSTDFEL